MTPAKKSKLFPSSHHTVFQGLLISTTFAEAHLNIGYLLIMWFVPAFKKVISTDSVNRVLLISVNSPLSPGGHSHLRLIQPQGVDQVPSSTITVGRTCVRFPPVVYSPVKST